MSIRAIQAEWKVADQLKKYKRVVYPLAFLRQVAHAHFPERAHTAEAYLLHEFDRWEAVPCSAYLDLVFGLDLVIMYNGRAVGIDVTTNPQAVAAKLRKQQKLAEAYQKLNITKTGVILIPCDSIESSLATIAS